LKNKVLILVISLSWLFVSCKREKGNISNRENTQIDSELESKFDYGKNSNNKDENLKNPNTENIVIELFKESKSIKKSNKIKKRRKKLLTGITPLSD